MLMSFIFPPMAMSRCPNTSVTIAHYFSLWYLLRYCGNAVMFLHVSVYPRGRRNVCLWVQERIVCLVVQRGGVSRHSLRTTPPSRHPQWPLQQIVCIILECILVLIFILSIPMEKKQNEWHRTFFSKILVQVYELNKRNIGKVATFQLLATTESTVLDDSFKIAIS